MSAMAASNMPTRAFAFFLALALAALSSAEPVDTEPSARLAQRWGPPGSGYGSGGYPGSSPGSSGDSASSNPFDGPGSGANGDRTSSFLGFDVSRATYIRNIHGILAAVAFVGVFPFGAVIIRVLPGRFAIWIHAALQVIGYAIFAVAAGLGIYMAVYVKIFGRTLFALDNVNFHLIIGLVVLGCLFFQPFFGIIHHIRFRRLGRRQIWSHLHLWTGRIFITLGIVNGGLGLWIASASRTSQLAYAIVAATVWSIWALVAIFSECRRDRAAAKARRQSPRRRSRI